jgi:ComF family protein
LSNWLAAFLNSCAHRVRSSVSEPCLLCGIAGAQDGLCLGCAADLPVLPTPACVNCAVPLTVAGICGACLAHPPRYDAVIAAYVYDFPVDALVQAYKYGGELRLARLLGNAVARRATTPVDVLVPMPLSSERLRTRGYNQALELAIRIGRSHGIPVWPRACRRVVDTPAQALLPWSERPGNVRGAFVCDADLTGLRVAVVDDVLTTGATLNELARNLKRAGATEVQGWVAARAVPKLYRRSNDDLE